MHNDDNHEPDDGITASYNSATGVLSLSSAGATATLAQWQAALRAVLDHHDALRMRFTGALSSALQQEPLAFLGLGKLLLQRQDLPGGDQRWQPAEFTEDFGERLGVRIRGLLGRGERPPARRRPVTGNGNGGQAAVGGVHFRGPYRHRGKGVENTMPQAPRGPVQATR